MSIRVTIEALGAQGDGLASHDGAHVFVPYTLAGEEVEITQPEAGRALPIAILKASEDRIDPICNHFARCGGCALQHLAPSHYSAFKRDGLIKTLDQAGVEVAEILPTWQAPLGARRRAGFGFARVEKEFALAFQEKGSINPVALEMCPVIHPDITQHMDALAAFGRLAHQHHKTRLNVTLSDNGLDVALSQVKPIAPREEKALIQLAASMGFIARFSVNGEVLVSLRPASHQMGTASVVPPPGGFLQAVKAAEDEMVSFALKHLKGAKKIADLFAGCGAFSFPLAGLAPVEALESERAALKALEDAKKSARGIKELIATPRDLYKEPLSGKRLRGFDGLMIDPPRAGAKAQCEAIAENPPPRLVMASCNPQSFARDAAILQKAGYRITELLPVDQFLYSPHLELIAAFERG